MENEGGKIDKWTIEKLMKNDNLNQCDIFKIMFLARATGGTSLYV